MANLNKKNIDKMQSEMEQLDKEQMSVENSLKIFLSNIKRTLNTAKEALWGTNEERENANRKKGLAGEAFVSEFAKKCLGEAATGWFDNVKLDIQIQNENEEPESFTVQIDHVLVLNGQIYAIETKTWAGNTIVAKYKDVKDFLPIKEEYQYLSSVGEAYVVYTANACDSMDRININFTNAQGSHSKKFRTCISQTKFHAAKLREFLAVNFCPNIKEEDKPMYCINTICDEAIEKIPYVTPMLLFVKEGDYHLKLPTGPKKTVRDLKCYIYETHKPQQEDDNFKKFINKAKANTGSINSTDEIIPDKEIINFLKKLQERS